mgnify:CR=1 FL=1
MIYIVMFVITALAKILRIENDECQDYSVGDINGIAHFFKVNLDDFVNKDLEKLS